MLGKLRGAAESDAAADAATESDDAAGSPDEQAMRRNASGLIAEMYLILGLYHALGHLSVPQGFASVLLPVNSWLKRENT